MIDRGIIKWQPFDSCYSSNKILQSISNEKNRKIFPVLSEDQLCFLEEKILESYHINEFVNVNYYYNGTIYKITGKIQSINLYDKYIYIKSKIIYFKQIINVY